jgi:hypothetical protein
MDAAIPTIQDALRARGFQLQTPSHFPEELTGDWSPAQKWRDRHSIRLVHNQRGGENLEAELTPFSSADTFSDVPGQRHFPILEVRFVEWRPGGFSPDGHRIYLEFAGYLERQDYQLVVVSEPPATDEAEHTRAIYARLATFGWWWLVSWLVGIATVGALANWLLLRMGVRQTFRRAVFVIVGIVLVTPLPYPAALASIPLPGLLWLMIDPVSYADYMTRWPFSGVVSGALSAAVAILLLRNRDAAPAQDQLAE